MEKWKSSRTILAVMLFTAMFPVTANAGDTTTSQAPGSMDIGVKAKYENTTVTPTVYKVDVEWGAMEFTYTAAGVNVWNPDTHEYELAEDNKWMENGNTITIKNHSNAAVEAALTFQAADGYALTGSFDKSVMELPTAEGTKPEEAPSDTAEFMLAGTLDVSVGSYHTVGQITVTVK